MIGSNWMAAALVLSQLSTLGSANTPRVEHLPPNEMGKVMVLMYHKIQDKEADGFSRSAEHFRHDLESLYERGYYLVNMVDLIDKRFEVPEGRTPVVLTFDDGAPGQFRKINGEWDPDSAVGMIKAMHDKHPDFGIAGSFYLNRLKDKDGEVKEMLNEMVAMGFELGNHTVTHPQLNKLSHEQVEKEIAELQAWIEENVPGYQVRTMAMPFGIYPTTDTWAADGEYQGIRYHNEALLKVGAEPSVSPFSNKFRPLHVSRVRGTTPYLEQAIAFFDKHPEQRFISDGDANVVTIPASRKAELTSDLPSYLKVEVR